jgi:outer membrane immunogenic protein
MKNTLLFVAILAVATPVMAADNSRFTGIRVEALVGANDILNSPDRNDVVYGAAVGVDMPMGKNFTVGVEASSTNIFETERTIGAAARIGYAVTPAVLTYGKVGYTNYQNVFSRKLDGVVVGAGAEFALGKYSYVKAEYNYSDLERNTGSHAGLLGVGLRF